MINPDRADQRVDTHRTKTQCRLEPCDITSIERGIRQRLGEPIVQWNARHLAKSLFNGLDGDIRVTDDTIIITYYNAPNIPLLKKHYESLPKKLMSENVDPRIPWLYNFKLDFRFK